MDDLLQANLFHMLKMASRLHQNVALKEEQSKCKKMHLVLNSPLGKIQMSGCEKGIHEIKLQPEVAPEKRKKEVSFTCDVSKEPEEMTESLKECIAWLETYFREPWLTDKLPIPTFHHPVFQQDTFTRKVLETLLKNVKSGDTVTYKKLADLSGNSSAARAVGGAMKNNPVPIIIPCHRVICSSGEVGNYMGGKENCLKEWLLAHEKIQKSA
uniref:Methylated-DNA--protein-cysteine methyltransferase n=1 Tax=Geotrypetes seraphini TaxID=260995 RepID=A0A6P8QUW5_GEOSA|nr:methylated-DNA--protein-cysteine methyltransferase isoform X3 [Geotrypetes seraphini]